MGVPLPPPWVMLSLLLGFSKHVQDVKEIGSLGWMLLRGRGESAGCQLCDKIVGVVLKQAELDDMSDGGGVDCPSICFRVPKCVRQCGKITSAMANSTGFPCIAAGLCPAEDEFGEVSCKFSYKTMGCDPPHACECESTLCARTTSSDAAERPARCSHTLSYRCMLGRLTRALVPCMRALRAQTSSQNVSCALA